MAAIAAMEVTIGRVSRGRGFGGGGVRRGREMLAVFGMNCLESSSCRCCRTKSIVTGHQERAGRNNCAAQERSREDLLHERVQAGVGRRSLDATGCGRAWNSALASGEGCWVPRGGWELSRADTPVLGCFGCLHATRRFAAWLELRVPWWSCGGARRALLPMTRSAGKLWLARLGSFALGDTLFR